MNVRSVSSIALIAFLACGGTLLAFRQQGWLAHMGKQPDGSYIVSSGQRIRPGTIAFNGRPADLAMRPQEDLVAVMVKDQANRFDRLFLINESGVIEGSGLNMRHEPGFHGMVWNQAGTKLYVSTAGGGDSTPPDEKREGVIEVFSCEGGKLAALPEITLNQPGEPGNVVPGSLCLTKDGSRLFVPAGDLNSVLEIDASTGKRLRKIPVNMIPFGARLTDDEQTLIVSNWGGRIPLPKDVVQKTGISTVVVDKKGTPSSGTVSIIDLKSGQKTDIEVGLHPTDLLVDGSHAYIANSMSDSITDIDIPSRKISRTIRLTWNGFKILGSMPVALAKSGNTLYTCNGGDNAVAEIDLARGVVLGYRPAGYYPISIALKGDHAWILNSKGNGSVSRLGHGAKSGNVHQFEGSVSILDLRADLAKATAETASLNRWGEDSNKKPDLAVYNGAIQHVLYIIKENRTYDEVFGDMPEGNGDPSLAGLGSLIMPNHQAIAREFTLFDNAYVSGTNSGDGHQWSTQSMANDYVEHFYVGYSRTYNDDGNCAMSISSTGCIWDAALAKGLSVRDYGEFCYADVAKYSPYRPKDWFEAWKDREMGTHKFDYEPVTLVQSLKPIVNKHIHYWPLIQSDQSRADEFIKEYGARSKTNTIPNLMILSLPCDHSEGMDPDYPQPKCMMADNDLALGRVIDAVSHSPQWANTCIFVIEDDAQSGPDHVDGHRTPYLVVSPFNKRHQVDHTFYTTVSMLKSIEMMLGLSPMNRFDYLATPITSCFQNKPDLSSYDVRPNRIRLDLPNPGRNKRAESDADKYWTNVTTKLDWSHPDAADSYWLNRIIWYNLHQNKPYPARPDERPSIAAMKDNDDLK